MAWQMAGIVYASLVIGLVFHLDQRAGLGDEEAGLRRDGGAGKGTLMTLAIVCAILLATLAGRWATAGARGENTLTEWAVGGRSLGTLIFWFANAGEVYTTFAVLGISGYALALARLPIWLSVRCR